MTVVADQVVIRRARREDASAIADVHLRSWQQTYQGILSAAYLAALETTLERRVAWFSEALGKGVPSIHVAEFDGRLLGFCSCGASRDEDVPAATGELMAIYLSAEGWGQGIGSHLWGRAREELEKGGYRAVTAWVLDGNVRAARFYRNAGFKADAASQRTFEENGEPLPLTRFYLALADYA